MHFSQTVESLLYSTQRCQPAKSKFWRIWTLTLIFVSISGVCTAEDEIKGKNVCLYKKYSVQPVHIRQKYQRPVHTLDLKTCKEEEESPCNRTITTYRTTFRTTLRMRIRPVTIPGCCEGWRKRSPHDVSCLESECSRPCENGGQCEGREKCRCAAGYMGTYCHVDIDECSDSASNPCQQKCTNTPGSYSCGCVDGFKLGEDNSSCELCLSCSSEFQELRSQVNSMPEELNQMAQQYTRVDTQADMEQAMKQQEEAFDKLQSQHDTIVAIQKQLDVLPQINERLDNLTELQDEVKDLRGLEARLDSLQDQVEDGLSSLKGSQNDLSENLEMAEQRWQRSSMASSQIQSAAIERLNEQQLQMAVRLDELEQENAKLRDQLKSVVALHETTMNALQEAKMSVTTQSPTTSSLDDSYYMAQSSSEMMPYARLASLSQQISILEEKMAECMCGQQYTF